MAPTRHSEVFAIEKRTGKKHPFLRKAAGLAMEEEEEARPPLGELGGPTQQRISELEEEKEACSGR